MFSGRELDGIFSRILFFMLFLCPMSMLSTFSKIFEKIVYKRILKFFVEHNVFSGSQHDFMKGKNVETAIFEHVDDILNSHENQELALGIFLDLSNAYYSNGRFL